MHGLWTALRHIAELTEQVAPRRAGQATPIRRRELRTCTHVAEASELHERKIKKRDGRID